MEKNLLEKVACICCESKEYTIIHDPKKIDALSKDDLLKVYKSSSDDQLLNQLVRCIDCGLVYLNPRVSKEIILASYSGAEDLTFITQNEERIKTFKKSFLNFAHTFSVPTNKNTRVLDIGCAGGAFPKAADDLGFNVVGIEPSKYLCEWGKKEYGLDLRPGILDEHDFEKESFDVITLWDVVEHLIDPRVEIKKISYILKKKGYLIVNYPDYNSLVAKLMGLKWPFFLSVHLFYFSSKTIKMFLSKFGFEIVELKPHWQTLKLEYVLRRASTSFGFFKVIQKFIQTFRLGNLPIAYYLGQVQVVARKV